MNSNLPRSVYGIKALYTAARQAGTVFIKCNVDLSLRYNELVRLIINGNIIVFQSKLGYDYISFFRDLGYAHIQIKNIKLRSKSLTIECLHSPDFLDNTNTLTQVNEHCNTHTEIIKII